MVTFMATTILPEGVKISGRAKRSIHRNQLKAQRLMKCRLGMVIAL
jgi:hypothetical protein